MKWGFKHIMLAVIMGFLFFPLVQNHFHLRPEKKLSGHYIPAENIGFSFKKWWSKEFQEKKEKYIGDHFGYRGYAIRIHNQIAFWLFKTAKANSVIVGKENYLYEKAYIDAYYGSDFVGVDSIRQKMTMVSYLADTFKKKNKTLLLIFAPGKAAFYPEFIPENKKTQRGITNMEVYLHYAKEYNIPHIDFHTWFNEEKKKNNHPYLLVPKYGIHWSNYGAYLAMDSMIKRLEAMRNIDMVNPTLKKYWPASLVEVKKDYPQVQDRDVEMGMNLLFKLKNQHTVFPEIAFEDTLNKVKPSTIMIADSYYWQFINYGISNSFDRNKADFWYYFGTAHNPTFDDFKFVDHLEIFKEVEEHDVIMIMSTDANLKKFGWNFIETMFEHYGGKLPEIDSYDKHHQKLMEQTLIIRSDSSWMVSIREKARGYGISADSMAYLDAKWLVEQIKK